VNAVWDLYARSEGKPLWKLLVDMTPEQIVSVIPFRHITDALKPAGSHRNSAAERGDLSLSVSKRCGPAVIRLIQPLRDGSGIQMTKSGASCAKGLAAGWTHFKMKVGRDLNDDIRRAESSVKRSVPDAS
jgi:L-fuconate dehydratase